MIRELLIQHKVIYIVGAQSRAKTLTGYLSFLYPFLSVEAYLVDELSQNDIFVQGKPVYKLENGRLWHIEYPVFIATKSAYHAVIQKKLHELGFQTVIPVTGEIDNYFRNLYVKKYYAQEGIAFAKIEDIPIFHRSAAIYMAKSVYDKPLQTEYAIPNYEKEIQVGAALTLQRLSPDIATDCEGDNISEKNRQYCELTALYWIWKNAKEDIVGLSHYRRHFILPDHWQDIMYTNNIDVILPVPTFVYPSVEGNYKERHDPSDWEYMMEYLKKNRPDDYIIAVELFNRNLYFPCNMFVMRREVLSDLCKWMFPVLDAVVDHGGVKEDIYLNRYPGFLSERLLTLFFYINRMKYKIVYTDKGFLV